MIFVTLGTQDKSFTRLLEAIDREIDNGTIKEKVIVQAGLTKYKSKNMEIFDLVPADKFEKYIDKASLIITHGGAGSILTAIKHGKKVIAAARLAKYKEHTNDHQKQIVKEFSKDGYILELRDFNKLGKLIEKSKTFIPKKFESNTKNMISLIENYIDKTNHISWYNRYREIISYLFFCICSYFIFLILNKLLLRNLEIHRNNIITWFIITIFTYITIKNCVFNKKEKNLKLIIKFFLSSLITTLIGMLIIHIFVSKLNFNFYLFNFISQIIIIILNFIAYKFYVFKN